MDKRSVTYGQVSLAAETLKKEGVEPSAKNIQEKLIKHADLKLIKSHLKEWQKNHSTTNRKHLPFSSQEQSIEDANQQETDNLDQLIDQKTHELRQSLALARSTLESTADGIMMLSNEGKLIDWNQKFIDIWRIPQEVISSRDANAGIEFVFDQLRNPDFVYRQIAELHEHPEINGDMGNVTLKDGRIIERYSQPHIVNDKIIGRVWSFRDITKRYQMTEALRLRQRAIDASAHGIIITDINNHNNIVYNNPSFTKISGFHQSDVLGQSFRIFLCGDECQQILTNIERTLSELKRTTLEFSNQTKEGKRYWCEMSLTPVPNSDGNITHYIWIVNDITMKKKMEEQLAHQATYDILTNLPNKLLLTDRIKQAILYAKRNREMFALLYLDLDSFKLVNDTMGHHIGDLLLIEIAKRIKQSLREFDTISRIGGDEFMILIQGITNTDELLPIVKKILKIIEQKFIINQNELNITGSLGISIYPKDGTNFQTLYKNADISMYEAKASERDTYHFYTEKLDKRIKHRMLIENSLPNSLRQNEFVLYYQPIIDISNGKVSSVEALVRWNHPSLGLITPDKFIDIVESSYNIIPYTQWALNRACEDLSLLHKAGFKDLCVNVNISGKNIIQSNLTRIVYTCLKKTGISPAYLTLEITERLFIEDIQKAIRTIKSLRKLGVEVAIDDFGVGYSSLNYLRLLPVSHLKIDRSFLSEIDHDSSNNAIALINSITAIAESLQIGTIAEGVETKQQLEFLKQKNCRYIQGYYFSKPLALEELKNFIKQFN